MASYVVMEPPARGGEEAVLVRDGFHLLAFLVPALWLLFNRLWLETIAVVAIGILLGVLGSYTDAGPAVFIASLMLAFLIGLEGASLKIAALRRRGWHEWGVVEAADAIDAETRYLAELPAEADLPIGQGMAPSRTIMQPPHVSGPALGMLDYPGRS